MQLSKRMDLFGESVFSRLTAIKNKRLAQGLPVYDFSIGTPNVPPAQHILDAITEAVADPKNYVYAINDLPELQDAVQEWYRRRYGVELDPRSLFYFVVG